MSNDAERGDETLEAEVLRLLKAGNPDGAFLEVERVLGGKARGYLRMATGSELHGDELYERVRVDLLRTLPTLTERLGKVHLDKDGKPHPRPLSVRAWLFTLVHNRFKNWRKRASMGNSPMLTGGAYVAGGAGPHTQLEQKERAELAQRLLSVLNEEQRHIYVLHVEEELSLQDVAMILDTTEAAVKMRYHRARKRLKEEWKKMNDEGLTGDTN